VPHTAIRPRGVSITEIPLVPRNGISDTSVCACITNGLAGGEENELIDIVGRLLRLHDDLAFVGSGKSRSVGRPQKDIHLAKKGCSEIRSGGPARYRDDRIVHLVGPEWSPVPDTGHTVRIGYGGNGT
jgi:hypothetical protein